jgi:hypothetical protein
MLLPAVLFDAVVSSNNQCTRSLRAIPTMHQIYTSPPGATLAVKVLESKESLLNAVWLPNSMASPPKYNHYNRHPQDKRDVPGDEEEDEEYFVEFGAFC